MEVYPPPPPPPPPITRGADLSALVREAAVLALQEYMQLQPLQKTASDQSNYSSVAEKCVVSMRNFKAALQKVKPSVSEKVG